MKTIEQRYIIKAPISKVWQALIDPSIIEEWGGGPAQMNARSGSIFSLWGGDIHGKNIRVAPEKLLKQDWFSGNSWKKPSKVVFKLTSKNNQTTVRLLHTEIPDEDAKSIEEGWRIYYLGPIQQLLEK